MGKPAKEIINSLWFNSKNPDLENLQKKAEEVIRQHSREVYLERLKRCGVIIGDKNE